MPPLMMFETFASHCSEQRVQLTVAMERPLGMGLAFTSAKEREESFASMAATSMRVFFV